MVIYHDGRKQKSKWRRVIKHTTAKSLNSVYDIQNTYTYGSIHTSYIYNKYLQVQPTCIVKHDTVDGSEIQKQPPGMVVKPWK